MLKVYRLPTTIFILSMFIIVSCGPQPAAPAAPEVATVINTVENSNPLAACGNFDVSKIIGSWKTENGPTESEFTFKEDCTVVANIERTGEEIGKYTLLEESKLLLSLANRESQVEIGFEGDNILIIEDAAADIKLTLQKSSK